MMNKIFDKIPKDLRNLIVPAIVVLIFAGVVYYINYQKNAKAGELTAQQAAEKAINFINNNMLQQGQKAVLASSTEESGVYKFTMDISGQQYDSYVSKDGKFLFVEGIPLTESTSTANQDNQNQSTEVTKSDRPDVKLFVMSYCPYGLQAQKMYLPAYNLLKGKADIGVYFVNYIMHGEKEIDENLNQYCIQKNEAEKYYAYLGCFVKEGKTADCMAEAKIDKTKITSCVSETDKTYKIKELFGDKTTWLSGQYPLFPVQDDLNSQYGVGGSPTIIINGTEVRVGQRTPEQFKKAICGAFNTPPVECSQTLSDTALTPGFGLGADTSGGSAASCE